MKLVLVVLDWIIRRPIYSTTITQLIDPNFKTQCNYWCKVPSAEHYHGGAEFWLRQEAGAKVVQAHHHITMLTQFRQVQRPFRQPTLECNTAIIKRMNHNNLYTVQYQSNCPHATCLNISQKATYRSPAGFARQKESYKRLAPKSIISTSKFSPPATASSFHIAALHRHTN